jgi:hypothetical protein
MKPLPLIIVAALAGGGLVWFLMKQSPEETPQHSAAAARGAQTISAAHAKSAEPVKAAPASPSKPSAADKAAEELKGSVLVNLGKVEDIGRQTGSMLAAEKELAMLRAIEAPARTPEQSRRLLELERQRATSLGALPEITGFQNNPDEYARFFGSLLQQAGNLDAAHTKAVTDYMHIRGEAMVAAGLNAAKEPTDPAKEEAWEKQRDDFNEETVDGIAKILPPGEAARIGFTDKFVELLEQDFDKAQ